MKAAVIHQLGTIPQCEQFPDPVPQSDAQVLMTVKAASVKNLDKLRAGGTHYASHSELPAVVGIDGVGLLQDGRRIYAQGLTGMLSEKALVQKDRWVLLPDGLDDATAAALPNAVIGAAMALLYRARIQKGDVVLINGATGVTGQLAVQLAKHYGASQVIATGRNASSLEALKALGADATISLLQDENAVIGQLKALHGKTPVHIVIDYLWGRPIELIMTALKGGGIHAVTTPVRIVTAGSMAGENMTLPSAVLRSSDIELLGSGIGSLSQQAMQELGSRVLPEMFRLAAEGKLNIATETVALEDIASYWEKELGPGKRLVVTM